MIEIIIWTIVVGILYVGGACLLGKCMETPDDDEDWT